MVVVFWCSKEVYLMKVFENSGAESESQTAPPDRGWNDVNADL
jgi:hypothetical protein